MSDAVTSPRGAAPSSVRTAALLTYALVAVAAVRLIAALVAKDSLVESFADNRNIDLGDEIGRIRAEDGAPAYVAIALISFIIFGALSVLLAQLFLKGSNGARWVAIVLGIIGALGGIAAFVSPAPFWYQAIGFISGVLSAAIAYYLLRSDSKAFFSA